MLEVTAEIGTPQVSSCSRASQREVCALGTTGQPAHLSPANACSLKARHSIDMGAGFDCFHETAHTNANVSAAAHGNRMLLLQLMQRRGFVNYDLEFWHFSLENEPYPDTFFDFPLQRPCDAASYREELQTLAAG
jgi:hypothetical protein